MRDIVVDLPPGLVGNPEAVPACPHQSFEGTAPSCAADSQIGVLHVNVFGLGQGDWSAYNLVPAPGVATELGFSAVNFTSLQYASLLSEEGYGLRISAPDLPLTVSSVTATVWGVPADPGHDPERYCAASGGEPGCVSETVLKQAYLTLPESCDQVPKITYKADSAQNPGVFVKETATPVDPGGQPAPMSGCGAVPFAPKASSQPTTKQAGSPSGLDFALQLPNQGLLNPSGINETEPVRLKSRCLGVSRLILRRLTGPVSALLRNTMPLRLRTYPVRAARNPRRSARYSSRRRCSQNQLKERSISRHPTIIPSIRCLRCI